MRSSKEKGVLKLVHAGRHVEIHREPITAAEVMEKNPRHSIARPDVFKFPWNVVRPESVLVPGEVFYIVPTHTIYGLLKARGCTQLPEQQQIKTLAIESSCAGMTPKHQNHVLDLKKLSLNYADHDDVISQEQDSYTSPSRPFQGCLWPWGKIVKNNKIGQKPNPYPGTSPGNTRSFHARISALPETENSDIHIKSFEKDKRLRSCLRKQDSARKSLNLKVSFVLPTTTNSQCCHQYFQQN